MGIAHPPSRCLSRMQPALPRQVPVPARVTPWRKDTFFTYNWDGALRCTFAVMNSFPFQATASVYVGGGFPKALLSS